MADNGGVPGEQPVTVRRQAKKTVSKMFHRDNHELSGRRGAHLNDGREWYWSKLTKHITAEIYGSVVPRCIIWALLGGLEGVLFKYWGNLWPDSFFGVFRHHTDGGGWFHPYSMNIFGMMVGWTLVMRIQIAYARYWEGTTHCHQAGAKWADAVMQIMTFDEASKDAFSNEALEFRMLVLHYASLMNALSLIDVRHDDELDCPLTINPEDPYLFRPNANPALIKAMNPDTNTAEPAAGGSKKKPGTRKHASHRMYTVPLQMLLRTRANLSAAYNTPINSFAPLEANERYMPTSHGRRTQDGGSGPNLFNAGGGVQAGLGAQDTSASRIKVKRGTLSLIDFARITILVSDNTRIRAQLAEANKFDVVGGISAEEVKLLEEIAPEDRSFVVQTWIVRMMTERLRQGGLAIPPPLLSRTYQVLSDGTAAMAQARKISYVAFPFPLRQLLAVLLLFFLVIAPMCIASFMRSLPMIGILSFFACLGYTALNEAAAELEQPFGLRANHLYLTAYQRQFNAKLARLFDQTCPALGYMPLGPPPSENAGLPPVPPSLGQLAHLRPRASPRH
mmetsp:Transcript_41512/g.109497  ORF Transcript_41512/g.109497 Transcript_41512/m.109497 type:complete len:563 (-) Transcript_41512:102-1790(-)